MGTLTAAQLGHRLQLVRSLLWQESLTGDEYASILLGFHAGPRSIAAEGLSRSRIGAWLCTDRLLAERVLAQPGFGLRRADGSKAHLQVMPFDEAFLHLEGDARGRATDAVQPLIADAAAAANGEVIRRHADSLLDTAGAVPRDLMADFAEPLAARVAAEVFDTGPVDVHGGAVATIPDALSTPATLQSVLTATQTLRDLGAKWSRALTWDEVAGRVSALVLYLATAPTLIAHTARRTDVAATAAVEEARREHPPLRLLSRVAHDDVELAGRRISAGEQVVVDTTAVQDGSDLAAADPAYAAVLPLVTLTAVVGSTALHRRRTDLAPARPMWHRRCPVTCRIARWEVA